MRKYLLQFSRIFVMRPSSCFCQLLGTVQCAAVCKKMRSICLQGARIFLNFSFAAQHNFPSLFFLVIENRRDKQRGNLFLFLLIGSATKYTVQRKANTKFDVTDPLQHSFHHFVEDKPMFSKTILFFLLFFNICEVPKN